VFYFFQRGAQYLRCEVRRASNSAIDYEIEIIEPGEEPRIEHYPSSDMVHKRWLQLQSEFQMAGWWGPAGRD